MSHAIEIRDVESIREIRNVEELQKRTWGEADRDIVPLNQLVAARDVGGTLIGAFDGDRLVGFVYGFYGLVNGASVHHSHMLAVDREHRESGIGERLKYAQRQRVVADGFADRITWTFDPLQCVNAHLNFVKLGVLCDTYKIDVYGDNVSSFLHQNGTDRLFVTWLLAEHEAVRPGRTDLPKPKQGDIVVRRDPATNEPEIAATASDPAPHEHDGRPRMIEIPGDINSVEQTDPALALRWRNATREAFLSLIAAGFIVTGFSVKDRETGSYLLERGRLERR